jgi:hypothetical protein
MFVDENVCSNEYSSSAALERSHPDRGKGGSPSLVSNPRTARSDPLDRYINYKSESGVDWMTRA